MPNEFSSLVGAPIGLTRQVQRVGRLVMLALANFAYHTYADSLTGEPDGETFRVVLKTDADHGVEIIIRDLILDTDRPICYTTHAAQIESETR